MHFWLSDISLFLFVMFLCFHVEVSEVQRLDKPRAPASLRRHPHRHTVPIKVTVLLFRTATSDPPPSFFGATPLKRNQKCCQKSTKRALKKLQRKAIENATGGWKLDEISM